MEIQPETSQIREFPYQLANFSAGNGKARHVYKK